MAKSTMTRIFAWSLGAFIAGAALVLAALWIANANGAFAPDAIDFMSMPWAAAVIVIGTVGALAAVGGVVGSVISWVGSLAVTSRRPDKTWFAVLLVLGLVSFGALATIAYLMAGPSDEMHAGGRALHTPA